MTANYQQQTLEIYLDPAASYWLKVALAESLKRDIVDAVNDVEVLLEVLKERLKEVLGVVGDDDNR